MYTVCTNITIDQASGSTKVSSATPSNSENQENVLTSKTASRERDEDEHQSGNDDDVPLIFPASDLSSHGGQVGGSKHDSADAAKGSRAADHGTNIHTYTKYIIYATYCVYAQCIYIYGYIYTYI